MHKTYTAGSENADKYSPFIVYMRSKIKNQHLPLFLCGLEFLAIDAHLLVYALDPVQRLVLAGLRWRVEYNIGNECKLIKIHSVLEYGGSSIRAVNHYRRWSY